MKREIWRMVSICIPWTVWLERNKACFEGKIMPISEVKNKNIKNLFLWCSSSTLEDGSLLTRLRKGLLFEKKSAKEDLIFFCRTCVKRNCL